MPEEKRYIKGITVQGYKSIPLNNPLHLKLGLHPYAIDQLAYMIKEVSLNTQVIIATQSPTLIGNFALDDITIIERDEDNQYTIANKMNQNKFSEWLKEYSVCELWAKNVIEGRP